MVSSSSIGGAVAITVGAAGAETTTAVANTCAAGMTTVEGKVGNLSSGVMSRYSMCGDGIELAVIVSFRYSTGHFFWPSRPLGSYTYPYQVWTTAGERAHVEEQSRSRTRITDRGANRDSTASISLVVIVEHASVPTPPPGSIVVVVVGTGHLPTPPPPGSIGPTPLRTLVLLVFLPRSSALTENPALRPGTWRRQGYPRPCTCAPSSSPGDRTCGIVSPSR